MLAKDYLKREVKESAGCTEPGCVAFAVSTAKKHLGSEVENVYVEMSKNIYKNGIFVPIPGSQIGKGNIVAAALAACTDCENPDLTLLNRCSNEDNLKARKFLDEGRVQGKCLEDVNGVYVKAVLKSKDHEACCIVKNGHSDIEKITVDGKIIFSAECRESSGGVNFHGVNGLEDIVKISEKIDEQDMEFILYGAKMNYSVAQRYYSDSKMKLCSFFRKTGIDDVGSKIRAFATIASYVRMSGINEKIMSSGGSGNQGITVTLPVYIYALQAKADDRKTAVALCISHIFSGYVKSKIGKINAGCGAFGAAGPASAAGISYLMDCSMEQMKQAVITNLSNEAGVICDGAKESCAFRIGNAAYDAYFSALMAAGGVGVCSNQGVINTCLNSTIEDMKYLSDCTRDCIDDSLIEILEKRSF
ncbi:MAG: serine dehydratase subunit alpha family protein [Petrotogaceae bacterium]|jgi:L-cysteine desulfidase|nr:serine dehydratase subunit alpha family protein [Petrotogaceae bacterium]